MSKELKELSVNDVAAHKDAEAGMYITIDDGVYDVTGGAKILKCVAGEYASKQFWKYYNEGVLKKYIYRLKISIVKDEVKL